MKIITNGTCSRCRRLNDLLEAQGYDTTFILLEDSTVPRTKSRTVPIVEVNDKLFYWNDYKSLDVMNDAINDYMDSLTKVEPVDPIVDPIEPTKPVIPVEPTEPKETIPKPDTKRYSAKIWNYLTAQFRYWLGYGDWIEEQATWRRKMIDKHSPICLKNKECIICECPIGKDLKKATLEYGDDKCEGGCFPDWMSKKEWINFKVNADI